MKTARIQAGLSLPSLLVVIVAAVFAVYTAFLLIPVYLDYFKVRSSVDSLAEAGTMGTSPPSAERLQSLLARRFQINQVTYVEPEDVNIYDEGGRWIIEVAYEVRKHWIGNVDLVIKFDRRAEVSSP